MAPVVAEFDGVWKKFRRGERLDSLRDLIPSLAGRLIKPSRPADLGEQEFWALKDVSFKVGPAQALGIIGPNGAGKSTTLKLLTKILRPTRGRCAVRGRVGALIEVAAGFHPDLTGRENVYLQGAILGMRRAEIARKFDDIVSFAGLEEFIDTPVKRYSSGMNARLGFSVAANLEPDALIIDEVLSVGDMAFQKRCVERMKEFKQRGVAIVFVSHNLQAIAELCDTAIHLDHGVQCSGPTSTVLEHYVRSNYAPVTNAPSEDACIRSARLLDRLGRPVERVSPGADLVLRVEYSIRDARNLTFGLLLHRSTDGLIVYDGNFTPDELGLGSHPSVRLGRSLDDTDSTITIDYCLLANVTRGLYHFECHVYDNALQRHLHRITPAASLTVEEQRTWAGVADLAVRPALRLEQKIATAS